MPSCEGQDAGRANGCLPLPRFWTSVVGSLAQRARANLSSGRLDIITFSTHTVVGAGDVRGAPLAGLVHPMAVLDAASHSRMSNCAVQALMRRVVRRKGSAACRGRGCAAELDGLVVASFRVRRGIPKAQSA